MSELSLEFGYSYIEVQHILGKMSVCKLWWENCLFAEMGWGIHYSTLKYASKLQSTANAKCREFIYVTK